VSGCRDCTTCTQAGAVRAVITTGVGLLHLSTCGISYLVKRTMAKHCPNCSHMLSSHRQRPDLAGWQMPVTTAPPAGQQPAWGAPQQPAQYPQQAAAWPPAQQPYPPQPNRQQPYGQQWPPTR
jgi:hypothetical protein